MQCSLAEKDYGIKLDMDHIDYDDKKVLDSIGTGKYRRRVPAGKRRHEELHEGVEAAEPGGYHRRNLPVPSGPNGFHSHSILKGKNDPDIHYL